MNLRELKSLLLVDTQLIVFRKSGIMLESCHSLTNLQPWIGHSLYESIPLLRSMRMVLEHLSVETIDIPSVDFVLGQRQGYYDFRFSLHPEDPDLILWLIKDQTRIYQSYAGIQQERNVLRMEKEYRERGKIA